MAGLRQGELRTTLEFLAELEAAPDLDAFARTLVGGIGALIPADLVSYNEVDPRRPRAFFLSNPAEAVPPGAEEVLERHMHENPLVVYHARTRDGRARKWSDFITQRQLHNTALYGSLFQPIGIERQMVVLLPSEPPLLIAVVLMRSGSDFSEDERTLFDLLRPRLARGYADAAARAALGALEEVLDEDEKGVLVLGPGRRPAHATARAAALVSSYFTDNGSELPAQLAGWLARGARAPLSVQRNSARLIVRRISATALLLEEERSLGLSAREAEVLRLAAAGWTNADIADALEISPRTVKKHLEGVYDKLGVRTRGQAVAVALQRREPPGGGPRKERGEGASRRS
jgi:DNA-binding CsgD family transcriptional regulator